MQNLERDENLTTLGGRIRSAADRAGLYQKDLARLSGIALRTLQNWIADKNAPPSDELQKIAQICGVPADWLLNGELANSPKDAEFGGHGQARFERDDELFGRVVDIVAKTYTAEGVRLAMIDLGRIASRKYHWLLEASVEPEERGAMIKLIESQLRAEIRAARAKPGTGKASA